MHANSLRCYASDSAEKRHQDCNSLIGLRVLLPSGPLDTIGGKLSSGRPNRTVFGRVSDLNTDLAGASVSLQCRIHLLRPSFLPPILLQYLAERGQSSYDEGLLNARRLTPIQVDRRW